MEFYKVLEERYSCKKYSDKAVEKEKLERILKAGNLAPTAKNLQGQRIFVLTKEDDLKKIDEITPCRYNAPLVLIVGYNKDEVFHFPKEDRDSGVEDASIVATHIMLAAANEGLGSCWLNYFGVEDVKKAYNIDENIDVMMLMDIGYPADDAGPLPNHKKKKDIGKTVFYL